MNLHKDPSSWVKVSPKYALKGSAEQAENVLQMALDDIGRMDTEINRLRGLLREALTSAGHTETQIKNIVEYHRSIRA